MYSNNLTTERYEIPTSDIERSRRYGSGIYPDYSRGYPMQYNIVNAGVSPAKKNITQSQQEHFTSRDSVAANLRMITGSQDHVGTELSSSSIDTRPTVPYQLNLENIFSYLNTQDPFQAFILEPQTSSAQEAIYNAIACKDLPPSVREKELDWPSLEARNLLGMISQDVLSEDRARLKKSFAMLKKVQYNSEKESELGKDISFLLHKYGKIALYRHVETYTECCRKVWHYYHPGHVTHPKDDIVFTPSVEYCYRVIFGLINQLTQPNEIWGMMVCNGLRFKDSCSALALTIQYDSKIKIPPESLTETFDSVYLTRSRDLVNIHNQNNYEIEHADCLNDTLTTWERVGKILCCSM